MTALDFIRDPDDPTFHPVRDVLERNVATQLRKITFSALVYGALVVVCLGGVVWGLAYALPGVLPIHWSSNEPVLEFPIDLLFYNFVMPLAVRFFRPSDGLHAMYTWWFRKCARILRLTWFMFDERKEDEEGQQVLASWRDFFPVVGGKDDSSNPSDTGAVADLPPHSEPSGRRRDGRYVRAPASDQVRIPKGEKVFLDVDEHNIRLDGKWDRADGVHGRHNEHFKKVYIPPFFRTRLFLFILFIWLFAAFTGVFITIVPLVFGRLVFAAVIPHHLRMNDVYAFSIGIYTLGSALYGMLHLPQLYIRFRALLLPLPPVSALLSATQAVTTRALRLLYATVTLLILLPHLSSLIVEAYILIPLHTYLAPTEGHTIHLIQSWTLGLLTTNLFARFIAWHADSRPAAALRLVTAKGYLNPDISVATRCFVVPATTILGTALFLPLVLGWLVNAMLWRSLEGATRVLVWRYSYPMTAALALIGVALWALGRVMRGWKQRVRDEAYLIGERLHNFVERKGNGANVAGAAEVGRGVVRER